MRLLAPIAALRLHEGVAATARDQYQRLPAVNAQQLLDFLRTL